jgi:C-terminal processing protease CtpA/Prc
MTGTPMTGAPMAALTRRPGRGAAWLSTAIVLVGTSVLLSAAAPPSAPPPTARVAAMSDQARDYLTNAIDMLEMYSVDAGKVDWATTRAKAFRTAAGAQTTADTYDAIWYVISHLRDPHTRLLPPAETTVLTAPTPSAGTPVGRLQPIAGRVIAMVTLPGIAGNDKATATYTRAGAAKVRELDRSRPCGWIVDLREDTGGGMGPMLVTLAPLLNGSDLAYFVDRDATRTAISLPGGRLFVGGEPAPYEQPPNPYRLHHPGAPVAILTGRDTASAGEITLIAFRGQPGTRTFGQSTRGLASGNVGLTLSDGAVLVVTDTNDMDRTGHLYPNATPIPPDEPVTGDDATVTAAIDWLARTPECSR